VLPRTVLLSPDPARKIIMHVRAVTLRSAAATAVVIGLVAGCAGPASFAERMAFLQKVANEGVQTHRLIVSQGGTTTMKRCTDAYNGLQDPNVPSDQGDGLPPSQAWVDQVQAFFVESCATGLPKAVPGLSASSPSGSPSSSPSGSPSSSPSGSPSSSPSGSPSSSPSGSPSSS
jgi:hypothetical protein